MAKETSRDRVLTIDEMRRVWTAFESEDPLIRAVFQLRLMTAQRGGEVMQMKWEDIDLANGWWSIPAAVAKNGKSHRVFLTPAATTILTDLRVWHEQRVDEINVGRAKKHEKPKQMSPWVFPSPRANEPVSWIHKAAQRIRKASGVDFRPHDLRRTAASLMTAAGTPRDVVKKLLNHADRDITAVYDRYSYDVEKKKALIKWGEQLDRIVNTQSGTEVLAFPARRA
jgi:integrase